MLTESAIRNIHNHVIEGSVRFDPIRNKQVCEIRTRGIDGQYDGNTRTLATSDLHQTFWTVETKKALDKLKAKAKRASKPKAVKAVKADKGYTTEFHADDEEVVILEDADFAALAKEEVVVDPLAKLRELVGA
jgi:hypothetical protein